MRWTPSGGSAGWTFRNFTCRRWVIGGVRRQKEHKLERRFLLRSIAAIAIAITIGLGYYAFRVIYVWWHVPEAYAAWDAGVLLVNYMEKHDNRWPSGWQDLEKLRIEQPDLQLRGCGNEPDCFDQLKKYVAINWSYDPMERKPDNPVTRPDGSLLLCLWADPNKMIDRHLDRLGEPVNGW